MRIVYARSSYLPQCRIERLRRYAFIGDSFTYGQGVTPAQTLPAAAERQMNACSADPIEAVNLGISGYNLWNSWLGFKAIPQVYDGVVITLCPNDMEFFGRSYNVPYQEPRSLAWEKTHPCGRAVASCFEDISAFSSERSLPVAVCYYNTFNGSSRVRISEILCDLCAAHGFAFIDSLLRLRDLKLSRDALRVSESDDHPSALVHETVGRYLVQVLQRQGWFTQQSAATIDAVADAIVSSARSMTAKDRYPPEDGLDWALRALEIKLHRARRLEASGAEDRFAAIVPGASVELADANRYWHGCQRIRTFTRSLSTLEPGRGWSWEMCNAEEERVRLEELGFALETGNWDLLSESLRAIVSPPSDFNENWSIEALEFFDRCLTELQHFCETLAKMGHLVVPAAAVHLPDTALLRVDLDDLASLADRVTAECCRLKESFVKLAGLIAGLRADQDGEWANDRIGYASSLASTALLRTKEALAFVPAWTDNLERAREPGYAAFTTIEVTIRGKAVENKPACLITVRAEYLVPDRLPITDSGYFFADGSCKLVTLCVPPFYAGRLFFVVRHFLAPEQPVEVDLIKVEVYNLPAQRRALLSQHFSRDEYNRFVSTMIYLF